jgi:hypothetical protein
MNRREKIMEKRLTACLLLLLVVVGCRESRQLEQQQSAGQKQTVEKEQKQTAEKEQEQTAETEQKQTAEKEQDAGSERSEPSVVKEESGEFIKVAANGTGLTSKSALLDAFRNATRQVVGLYVDAETLIKNDELVEDKVLTYSDGFVKQYETISERKKDGLVRIKIHASIEKRSVIAKLRAANITLKKLDGQGLFAEAVTQLEAEQGAEDLLRKAFKGFPQSLLTAKVIGRPELVEKSNDRATVRIQVQLEPDLAAYKSFVARIQPMLEKVAKDKGEFTAVFEPDGSPIGRNLFVPKGGANVWGLARWMPKSFSGTEPIGPGTATGLNFQYTTLALTTQRSKLGDRLECRYYLMDKSLQPLLADIGFRQGSGKLSLLDADGGVVFVDRFPLRTPTAQYHFDGTLIALAGNYYATQNSSFYMLPRTKESKGNAFLFWISPVFMNSGINKLRYKPSLPLVRTITLSLDELKSVQTAKCEIVFPE